MKTIILVLLLVFFLPVGCTPVKQEDSRGFALLDSSAEINPKQTREPASGAPAAGPTGTPTNSTVQMGNCSGYTPSLSKLNYDVTMCDDFLDPGSSSWDVGDFSDEWTIETKTISAGFYSWHATSTNEEGLVSWQEFPGFSSDFEVSALAEKLPGSNVKANYAIIFREKSPTDHYWFSVNPDEQWFMILKSVDDELTVLDERTSSEIKRDQPNWLSVVANGIHFQFFINEQLVAEIDDSDLTSGKVGIGVEAPEKGNVAVVDFDRVILRSNQADPLAAGKPTTTIENISPPMSAEEADSCMQDVPLLGDSDLPLITCDDFLSNSNDWEEGTDSDDLGVLDRKVEDGSYVWNIDSRNSIVWWDVSKGEFGDFELSVLGRRVKGTRDTSCFMFPFHVQVEDAYFYQICDDQTYAVEMFSKGVWKMVIEWKKSDFIKPDKANWYTVVGEDNYYIFYINGQRVYAFKDDTLPSGYMGLGVSIVNSYSGIFKFDKYVLRARK